MILNLLLSVIGFSSGFLVAGGVVALMVGLGILSRFIEISRTAKHVLLYEDCILLGAIFGNLVTIYQISVPLGTAGLAILGICSGIYVGGWIMALAEINNVFPVFARRLGITKGISFIIIAIAVGKIIGGIMYFFLGW